MQQSDAGIAVSRLLGDAFLDNDNWAHWDAKRILAEDQRLSSRGTTKHRETDLIELFFGLYLFRTQLFHGCAGRGDR